MAVVNGFQLAGIIDDVMHMRFGEVLLTEHMLEQIRVGDVLLFSSLSGPREGLCQVGDIGQGRWITLKCPLPTTVSPGDMVYRATALGERAFKTQKVEREDLPPALQAAPEGGGRLGQGTGSTATPGGAGAVLEGGGARGQGGA